MQLPFQSLYALILFIGLTSLVSGGNLLNSDWISGSILIIAGTILTYYGVRDWYKKQKNEEKLVELEVERKNAILDFDIKEIDGENDVIYEPEDFDEAGQPSNFKPFNIVNLKIRLVVFNPCSIKNVVRDIKASIERDNKLTELTKEDFIPIKIEPDEYVPIGIKFSKFDYNGVKNDKIIVTIFTIDKKPVPKEEIIKYYSKGDTLRDLTNDF